MICLGETLFDERGFGRSIYDAPFQASHFTSLNRARTGQGAHFPAETENQGLLNSLGEPPEVDLVRLWICQKSGTGLPG